MFYLTDNLNLYILSFIFYVDFAFRRAVLCPSEHIRHSQHHFFCLLLLLHCARTKCRGTRLYIIVLRVNELHIP